MRVLIDNNIKINTHPVLELGDIVYSNKEIIGQTNWYIVVNDTQGYILKALHDGCSGLTGYHSDLERLTGSLQPTEKIYKKSEYEFIIRKRENNSGETK